MHLFVQLCQIINPFAIINLSISCPLVSFTCQLHSIPNKYLSISMTWNFLITYVFQNFSGNYDNFTPVKNVFNPVIVARFVQIDVQNFKGYPCLRFELYGQRTDAGTVNNFNNYSPDCLTEIIKLTKCFHNCICRVNLIHRGSWLSWRFLNVSNNKGKNCG